MARKKTNTKTTSVKSRLNRRVKLAVVPQKANNYRPHAVRRYGIAVIVVFAMVVQGAYNGLVTGNVLGSATNVTLSGLLEETNKVRAAQGDKPLTLNPQLVEAASLKAKDMFEQQYWAHVAPDGTTPWQWFGAVDYSYAVAGENLAKNFTNSGSVVSAWLDSPTHRDNVLKNEYTEVGFAIREGKLDGQDTSIVVALYAAPASAAVQGVVETTAPVAGQELSLAARLGLGVQSLTPAAIGSLVLLVGGAGVAFLAHAYRKRLPLALKRSWYQHHGAYKAAGFMSLAFMLVLAYGSGGQI